MGSESPKCVHTSTPPLLQVCSGGVLGEWGEWRLKISCCEERKRNGVDIRVCHVSVCLSGGGCGVVVLLLGVVVGVVVVVVILVVVLVLVVIL